MPAWCCIYSLTYAFWAKVRQTVLSRDFRETPLEVIHINLLLEKLTNTFSTPLIHQYMKINSEFEVWSFLNYFHNK